jgi:hypothetical protein
MFIAMLAGLTACKKDETPEPEPAPRPTVTDDVPAVPFDPETYVLYTTVTEVYEKNNIRIPYPQIEGLRDTALQQRLNLTIRDLALEILYSYSQDTHEHLTLEVDYEVTRSTENLMSTVFRGTAFIEGGARPGNIFYTVNVDIQTGAEVALGDIIRLGDEFVEIFRAHGRVQEIPDAEDYIKENNNETLLQMFRNSDMFEDSDIFSYFTDNAVFISFGVPHAIGGYAEFEINYDVLSELIHEWRT